MQSFQFKEGYFSCGGNLYHVDVHVNNASLNVANIQNTALTLYNLSLLVAPALRVPLPSEVQFREGESLNMSCLTSGHPPPVVKWEKEMGKYLTR